MSKSIVVLEKLKKNNKNLEISITITGDNRSNTKKIKQLSPRTGYTVANLVNMYVGLQADAC